MRDGSPCFQVGGSVHGVAQVLWTGCHGLVTYLITNPGFGYVEVDELKTLMVDGLVDDVARPHLRRRR